MKRVVFSSTFIFFFFLLFTLSNGLRVIDLTEVHDHHHLQNKPSSDGSDSSKFIFPTKLSSVPEANKPEFEPESTEIEFKEAIEVENPPNFEYNYMDVMNRHPVRINNAFNRFSLPIIRVKSHGCRQFHRLMHHPDRFIGANEVGFATVEESNHRSHHHHHHDHDHVEEDDQAAEMMTEILEEKKDNKDENENELQKDLMKIGKFLGYF